MTLDQEDIDAIVAALLAAAEANPIHANIVEVNGAAATPVDDLPRNVTVTQRSVVVNDN